MEKLVFVYFTNTNIYTWVKEESKEGPPGLGCDCAQLPPLCKAAGRRNQRKERAAGR